MRRFFFVLVACLLQAAAFAPALCRAQPSAPAQGDEEYVAQPGDTMNAISQRLLHEGETPRVQRALQQYNRLGVPDLIHPGQVIRIPRAWMKSQESGLVVVAVQGEVQSKGQPLRTNARIAAGDDLRTGRDGYATLKLADGSTITLLPSASAAVERAQATPSGTTDTRVRLDVGRAETAVQKAAKGTSRFEVRTPMAIAAVRGTKFRVVVDGEKNATMNEVLEGSVGVSDAGSQGTVAVNAGFGTRVAAGSAPLPPRALLPAPFLWNGVQLVERPEVTIPVNPLRGAQRYRLFLSSRQDFTEILREEVIQDPQLRFTGLRDGEYWVRLRGIDDIDLEGRDATANMRVRIRPAAPTPTTPPNRSRTRGSTLEFNWQAQPGAERYVLQVARDPAFRNLLGEWSDLTEPRYRAQDVPPGDYYWRIAASLADGKRSLYSEVRTFQLRPLPKAPDAVKVEEDSILLSWPSEPGQTFELQFAADPEFSRIVDARRTTEPRVSVPRPDGGVYYARVRATDPDGAVGPFTDSLRIEVKAREPRPSCLLQGPGGVCALFGPAQQPQR